MFKWLVIIQKTVYAFQLWHIILQSHQDEYVVCGKHTTVKDALNKGKLDVEAINFYTKLLRKQLTSIYLDRVIALSFTL